MGYIHIMEYYQQLTEEWSTDTDYNVCEPWEHYVEWKKPVTKDHTLYKTINMKRPEQANPKGHQVD